MNILSKIYFFSPFLIQKILLNVKAHYIKSFRYGKDFHSYLKKFNNSKANEIDVAQFRKFLVSANATSFWKEKFKEYNIDIESQDIINEIQKHYKIFYTIENIHKAIDNLKIIFENNEVEKNDIEIKNDTWSSDEFVDLLSEMNKTKFD